MWGMGDSQDGFKVMKYAKVYVEISSGGKTIIRKNVDKEWRHKYENYGKDGQLMRMRDLGTAYHPSIRFGGIRIGISPIKPHQRFLGGFKSEVQAYFELMKIANKLNLSLDWSESEIK